MIEVGEYVRTKKGQIDKIYEYKKDVKIYICEKNLLIDTSNLIGTYAKDIVKHSKNIIDLIEEGDYVNGHLVRKVYLEGATKYIKLDNSHSVENDFAGVRTYSKDIKSLVTKEQFSSVEYRLE